jgi:hypothetical protein
MFEPEPLNPFKSIEAIRAATSEEEIFEASSFEQSDIPSPGNTYLTDAARGGGGLDINDPVFREHWTKYAGLHCALLTNCDPEESCDCEGHNCVGAQSIIGYAAATATTAKSLGVSADGYSAPEPDPIRNLHLQLTLVDVFDPQPC